MQRCYFCESQRTITSISQRAIKYDNQIYQFVRCHECRGYSLFPTLTDTQLFDLYSSDYVDQDQDEPPSPEDSSAVRFSDLKAYLRKQNELQEKVFLDYGCGANPVSFQLAQENGFLPRGMELSADVRELAALNTGVKLFSQEDIREGVELFDTIFLGDVLEHLVDPISELKFLRTKLAVGGVLLAQGPLQGTITLTHLMVRLFAWGTRGKVTTYPPYHVSLASTISMKKLLETSGFQLTHMKIFEVDWPAPSFVEVRKRRTPRNLALFLTKKIDKILAAILPNYGTRYFLSCSSDTSL